MLDGFLTQVPVLEDWRFGQVTADLGAKIAGDGTAQHALVASLLVTILWAVLVLVPGWLRLLRGDLK